MSGFADHDEIESDDDLVELEFRCDPAEALNATTFLIASCFCPLSVVAKNARNILGFAKKSHALAVLTGESVYAFHFDRGRASLSDR